ncbi:MAG: SGNH/GDSL hydrolase family protein [Clostridia bacterium]|nr:SGNH/GDSL hydrolase family protein [Clostridia bacterium]
MTNEELKKIYFGAYSFKELEGGWLQAFQYTDEQMEYLKSVSDFWYGRSMGSNSKTIEFITAATKVSFEYKLIWIGSYDSIELMVDGLITDIAYVQTLGTESRIEWELPEGEKNVVIYLPSDATAVLRNFEVNAPVKRPEKNEKVLWLGDSITQGFGPLRSSLTYICVANRVLNYDIINQGIGGYVYDKNVLMKMEGYMPDKIIIALGTNQFNAENMKDVEEYYDALIELYGEDMPVLCISPVWRGNCGPEYPVFVRFCENVKEIAGRYKNVKVVDGFKLIPHLNEYYLDSLHPNGLGSEEYGRHLVDAIRTLGF